GVRAAPQRTQPREVEHQPALAHAVAGKAVAAPTDGELDSVLLREPDDPRHSCIFDGPHDRSRMLVESRKEDPARRVVRRIVRTDHLPGELQAESPEVERRLRGRAHDVSFQVADRWRRVAATPGAREEGDPACAGAVNPNSRSSYESRKRRTASTRRWSSGAAGSRSLVKMFVTCFSTARDEMKSRSPIAWF